MFLVDPSFNVVLQASDFFAEPMLDHLLETAPMLVPFPDNENCLGLCHVAVFLVSTLHDLLYRYKGLGGYENSWRAFQLELALDELFFGGKMHSLVSNMRSDML